MLKHLELRNFKGFEHETFLLSPLTLLMGENAAGKSSIIQAILLLRQSMERGLNLDKGLTLNGRLCSLGVGRDLLREAPMRRKLELG
jgi:predicted ATPase